MHLNPPLPLHYGVTANRTFCPVHGFWATDRGRLTPGGLLSPNTSSNNFNQQLKRVTRDLNYEDGRRYASHALRRGAALEIPNPGSAFPTVLKSGTWTPGCYKCYVGLRADDSVNISAILASAMDSDIEDPYIPPTTPGGKKRANAMGAARRLLKKQIRAIRPQ